ncbi:MAG: hypothetical protein ABGX87_17245 [Alcanivorax sp.]|uniref:Zinc resistance-associated protein n=1 Tax=Alloalcanivorax marinus TaxID=1177169 RepID=A0A9Q3UT95_9GAMM|nr:hypothetical protein [Alloalcanivorax marinus]MCC4310633.1 hypothetical protein [Alloalcanivorax marinus]
MTTVKRLSIAMLMALGVSGTALAQQGPGMAQGDQVDQLDQLVSLSADQKKEMRELMQDSEAKINSKRMEAQELQQSLSSQIGPDYDEDKIRDDAEELGELTGDIAAETVLLQARIQENLTEEQRNTLEERARQQREQMRQMQEQMRQQQGQQQ